MSRLLDEEILGELVEIMGDDINMLLKSFISDSEGKISHLKVILDSGDGDEIRRLTHSLRGSSRNIGASELADACGRLEIAGREGTAVDATQAFLAIKTAYEAVKQELNTRFLMK